MTLTSKNLILVFLVKRAKGAADRGKRSGRYTGGEGRGGRKREK